MNKAVFREYLKPVVVLVAICLAAAVLLGFVNGVTAPVIDAARQEAANATRREVLPDAEDFEPLDCTVPGVTEAFRDTGGSGYVITAAANGYAGPVTVTAGLTPDGAVLALKADVSAETATIGGKYAQPDILARFVGAAGSADGVDGVAGATRTGDAVKTALNAIFAAYEEVKEAQ